ncbi:DDE-domain-containing protein [Conidiobolus coronatus NRRL 28638]|uniref:DDE-domain-containing protein n=1 Tax=Conidiobolus coronatus (strain ATCC 28846 / CBS 209.66 / NRRL 28638) TaxID=796925 RepID=A0A137NYR9_CONC2|nr:DDE-domain-containing protein [Conidiobolus coronatus NRRL 28638]|eukprot:KXN67759.1 DDE-domain-containing protein [Conidiobolus coronatus NRRL 28638]
MKQTPENRVYESQEEIVTAKYKTTLDFKTRLKVIKKHLNEPYLTLSNLKNWLYNTERLRVHENTISRIISNINMLLSSKNLRLNQRREKSCKFPKMESALFKWIKKYKQIAPTPRFIIKEIALELCKNIGEPGWQTFTASNGWFNNFIKRYGLKRFKNHGEANSVSEKKVKQELEKINAITKQYSSPNIFNIDESCLFYKQFDDVTYSSERRNGCKKSKQRYTIFFCTNSTGMEKLPVCVISKAAKPLPFRNIDLSKFRFNYYFSENSWMVKEIFCTWIKDFDQKMQGRKVLLLMDNFGSHKLNNIELRRLKLQNTRILYLPKNTTSKLQPLDQGIISSFKSHYKSRYIHKWIANIRNRVYNPEQLNILESIIMAIGAWDLEVTPKTINNCFKSTGIESKDKFGPLTKAITLYMENDLLRQKERKKLNLSYILS